jgi:hypothetical protein
MQEIDDEHASKIKFRAKPLNKGVLNAKLYISIKHHRTRRRDELTDVGTVDVAFRCRWTAAPLMGLPSS